LKSGREADSFPVMIGRVDVGDMARRLNIRGKRRLVERLSARRGIRRATLFGAEFELDLGEFIQRQMYFGCFEALESRAVADYLRPGMTVVDAGANVGFYTALAAERCGERGRVIAYEPSPYASARLRAMVERNRLRQVTVVEAALGDAAGRGTLYIERDANHSPSLIRSSDLADTIAVEVRSLDAEAARLGLEKIDLLKLDVEGYEAQVVSGADELLRAGRIGAVLCELHGVPMGLEQWGLCRSEMLNVRAEAQFWIRRCQSGA
ncbi:MAG TPA: FkbM family methyltransferase, partial [Terriglobales bacterium]|nr:FkbM family methyltransferase [Terriglobales bacterium]